MNTPQFVSSNGFPPRIWGPLCWKFSHYVTANYPLSPSRRDIESHMAYFSSLCQILPCRDCRKEFCKIVRSQGSPLRLKRSLFVQKKTDPPGTARKRVFTWFVRVHANVNERLRKKSYPKDPSFWANVYASRRKA